MAYGAVYSQEHQGDPNYDQAKADWEAVLRNEAVEQHTDTGGRTSVHRRGRLIVAVDDLDDRRLADNRADLGITEESYERAREEADRRRRIGFVTLELEPGQAVVPTTEFLRSLGGRRPLRLGPDHVIWPAQGRPVGPAAPPTPTQEGLEVATAARGASRVLVAVIDTGFIKGNPVLDACVDGNPESDTRWDGTKLSHWVGGHGIHVAGVLVRAARGVVRVRHYDAADGSSQGLPIVTDSTVAEKLVLALDAGCRVINMSLGGPTALDLGMPATGLALAARLGKAGAADGDAVIVASAGNEATTQPFFPAAFKGVVGVGALDGDVPASFSNHGWWVDCAAAGVDIIGPYVDGQGGPKVGGAQPDVFTGHALWSGTSFAAPHVSGLIAAALAGGLDSARVAAATVLAGGTPLDPAFGLGVRVD